MKKKGRTVMENNIHFSVYEHTLVIKDNLLISRKFIVLKNAENRIVAWTDFHRYIRTRKRNYAKNISDDGNKRAYYIVKLLNYAFFNRYQIKKLTELNAAIVKDFLNDYGQGLLPNDEQTRNETTVNICIYTILDFLEMLYNKNRSLCSFRMSEFYKIIEIQNKYGKIIKKKIPAFDVRYISNPKQIFRDMPESVFTLLMDHIMHNHKDILMLVALSAFGGLRPSECCNVRRPDSKLGPGIMFSLVDDNIYDIMIDLRKELNIRSGSNQKRKNTAYPSSFSKCFL